MLTLLFADGITGKFKEGDLQVILGANFIVLLSFVIATGIVILISRYLPSTVLEEMFLSFAGEKLIKGLITMDIMQGFLFMLSLIARSIEEMEIARGVESAK